MTYVPARQVGLAETAKLVRQALKERWPTHRFGVRIQRHSAGGWITVSWTDGPSVDEVETLTQGFRGQGYDSLSECRTYHDVSVIGAAGASERVHFACERVACVRATSPQLRARAEAQLLAGRGWVSAPADRRARLAGEHYCFDDLVARAALSLGA